MSFLFHLGLELSVPLEPKPRISPCAFNARYRLRPRPTCCLQFVPLSLAFCYFVDAPAEWVFVTGAVAITYPRRSRNARDFNGRVQCSDCLCSGRSRPSSNLRAQ